MPPPPRPRRARRVELRSAAAGDREDAIVHLDEHDERAAVGQVDDLVRQVRDALDVVGPGDGRDEQLDAPASCVSSASISAFSRARSRS